MKVFVHLFQKVADSKGSAFGRHPQMAECSILQAYLGVWGPLQEKGPQGPSQFQQPKGGGRLVSTHAALSPELGSKLKARSGCKSGTTAPGVQGAGRGPLATSLVTFLFAQESNPPVGAGPDNPSGRMPENSKEGKPIL